MAAALFAAVFALTTASAIGTHIVDSQSSQPVHVTR